MTHKSIAVFQCVTHGATSRLSFYGDFYRVTQCSVVCCNRCSFIYSVSQSVSLSICQSVGPSVSPSVCLSHFCTVPKHLNVSSKCSSSRSQQTIIPTFSRTKLRCRIQAIQTQRRPTGLNTGWTWFWPESFLSKYKLLHVDRR